MSHRLPTFRNKVLIFSTMVVALLTACSPTGEQLPDFEVSLYDVQTGDHSETLSTQDLKGQIVVLNFWATWCAPCRAEMPDLDLVHSDMEQFGLNGTVLGIDQSVSLNPPDEKTVDFLKEIAISYPVGAMNDADLSAELQIVGLPTTLLINRNGRIEQRWAGIVTRDQLLSAIKELDAS